VLPLQVTAVVKYMVLVVSLRLTVSTNTVGDYSVFNNNNNNNSHISIVSYGRDFRDAGGGQSDRVRYSNAKFEKCAFSLDLSSGCKMFLEKGVSCHQLMMYGTDLAFADGDTHG